MSMQEVERPLPDAWPESLDPAMLDKIIDVIATEGRIGRAAISPTATLETLGLESMDVVMILAGLEDVLDAYIPMNSDLAASRNLAEFVGAAVAEMKRTSDGSAAKA